MAKDIIKFLKVRPVKSPTRAYEFDAGIDFYVPEFTPKFIEDLQEKNPLIFYKKPSGNYISLDNNQYSGMSGTITFSDEVNVKYELSNDDYDDTIRFDKETGKNYFLLAPHARVMIPSGIKSRMAEPGRALIAANKSGIATKHGLIFGAQVVDYTYKGEIHISIVNTSTKDVRIYEDMKIIQFLEMPVYNSTVEVEESLYERTTDNTYISLGENKFYKGLKDDRGADGFGSTDKK